jgi:hypothetical protein
VHIEYNKGEIMATYYASPTGSGTTCSVASPCALDYTIATKATTGDTVIALTGTYGPFNQISFSGVRKTVTTDGGVVSVSFNSGQNGLYLSSGAAGSLINGITFTGAGSWQIDNRANNVTISNCIFDTLSGQGIYDLGGTGTVISKCIFRDVAGQTILNEGGAESINYSLFFRSGTGTGKDCINSITAAQVTINNCMFAGGGTRSLVRGSGSGTVVTINNSTFLGAGGNIKYPDATIEQANSATVTVNNSIVGGNMLKTGLVTYGTVTLNNVQQSTDPLFNTRLGYNDAIVTFYAVDSNHLSTGSMEHYQAVADAYGVHFSYFPDDTDHNDVSDFATELKAFVAAGHDLGCEGKSSSPLDTGIPFTVAYSGAGANPRVVVTYTSDDDCTVALITDSGTDATFETGKTQTHHYINEVSSSLTTAISAVSGWAATVVDGGVGDYDDTYSYCLAAGTYPISGATNILLDKTGRYFNEEIVLSKSDIETVVGSGYVVKSYFYPRYKPDDDAAAAIKAAGYTSALSGQNTVYQLSSIATMYSLTNDWLGSNVWWNTNMKGSGYDGLTAAQKEARVRAWVRDMAIGMRFYGYWYAFCLPENSALPDAEFGWVLSEFQNMGVRILSFAEAQAYIASTSTASGDGYTRAFTQSYDGRLRPGSPAINAGVDVGLTTDFLGYPVIGVVDIGAYEYIPVGGSLTNSTDMNL